MPRHSIWNATSHMKQTSYPKTNTMLSLSSEWTDYFGPTPTSPVHNNHNDNEGDDSSCCSPEPLSPPRSPLNQYDYSCSALPELPSLSLSPRSVVDGDGDDDFDNSSSSFMCVYDLDTLCATGDMSFDMNPASLFDESILKKTSNLMPYVVDLLSPTLGHHPRQEEEKKEEDHHDYTPLHNFHQPLEPDTSSSSSLPTQKQRRKRKRRRSKSRHRINLDSGRSVLVESLCDTVTEEEDTEQIEVIYLLVRSAH